MVVKNLSNQIVEAVTFWTYVCGRAEFEFRSVGHLGVVSLKKKTAEPNLLGLFIYGIFNGAVSIVKDVEGSGRGLFESTSLALFRRDRGKRRKIVSG
jgi:hypothetical protein